MGIYAYCLDYNHILFYGIYDSPIAYTKFVGSNKVTKKRLGNYVVKMSGKPGYFFEARVCFVFKFLSKPAKVSIVF